MAINPHDNYEKLAKLLYPSIEASGNVYYGQTRKLALDELFDKNKGGFHAHIESLYNDDSAKYETFFCWELGPLKGIISVDSDLPCVPIYFAKYKLNIISSEDDTDLYSGNFKTYKQSVTAVYNGIFQTNGKNPINNSEDWDGANFYISKEDSNYYIYIALKNITYEKYEEPEYVEGNELTFTVLDNDVDVALVSNGTIANKEVYEYSINDDPWDDLDADSNTVTVEYGDYIKFRLKANEQKSQQSYSNNLKFSITGTGHISISGDIRSLQQDKYSIAQYEFCDLFKDNATIVDVSKLELPTSTLALSCYYGMFRNCTALINMPILPSINVINTCYSSMFNGCTSLKDITPLPAIDIKYGCYMSMFYGCTALTVSPSLHAKTLVNNCYAYMFYNCSNLNKVCIHAEDISATNCLLNWLSDVATNGDFYCVSEAPYPAGANGIPAGWTHNNIYGLHYGNGEYLFNKLKVNESLITSGADSIYNGRGLLSEASSLYKYEKIFNENNNHKMNSYNNDGSFNQEIWGYKSFNSPVKFRNGIYNEFGYITDYTDSNNKNSILVSTCNYNNKAASIILTNDSAGNTSVNIIADHVLLNNVEYDPLNTVNLSGDQNIYGTKTFKGKAVFEYTGNDCGVFIDCIMQCEGKSSFTDTATFGDVIIGNIGGSDNYVNQAYITNISCSGDIGSYDEKVDTIYADKLFANTIQPDPGSYASSCIGYKSSNGTLVRPYKEAYITDVYIRSTSGADSSLIFSSDSKIKLRTNTESGDKAADAKDLVTGVDVNNDDNGGIIISSLNGVINPKLITMKRLIADVSRDHDISISNGSLVMAFIYAYDNDDHTNLTVNIGNYINFNHNDMDPTACGYLAKCTENNSYVQTNDMLPDGRYVAFCDIDIQANHTSGIPILLMKVAE